jgi:hypothetical protein
MKATRNRPPIIPSRPGEGKGAEKFKRRVSQESRQRLSEIATQRHRQGGFKKSSDEPPRAPKRAPSQRRIAARVAEAAREEKAAQDIIDVFKDGIDSRQPINIRLKAAEAWIKVEQDDAKLQLREADSAGQQRDRGELLSILAGRLTQSHSAGLLRRQIEERSGITDAEEVIDVDATDLSD